MHPRGLESGRRGEGRRNIFLLGKRGEAGYGSLVSWQLLLTARNTHPHTPPASLVQIKTQVTLKVTAGHWLDPSWFCAKTGCPCAYCVVHLLSIWHVMAFPPLYSHTGSDQIPEARLGALLQCLASFPGQMRRRKGLGTWLFQLLCLSQGIGDTSVWGQGYDLARVSGTLVSGDKAMT